MMIYTILCILLRSLRSCLHVRKWKYWFSDSSWCKLVNIPILSEIIWLFVFCFCYNYFNFPYRRTDHRIVRTVHLFYGKIWTNTSKFLLERYMVYIKQLRVCFIITWVGIGRRARTLKKLAAVDVVRRETHARPVSAAFLGTSHGEWTRFHRRSVVVLVESVERCTVFLL